jgi:DNA gyrase subunit B
MPEVIEKGYLYIAQPPLLKVGKGKNEVYLKEESDLNEYVLKRISSQKKVVHSKGEIKDHTFYLFVCDLAEYFSTMEKFKNQGIKTELVETLLKEGIEDKDSLKDEQKVKEIRNALLEIGYEMGDVKWNEDRNVHEMKVNGYPKTAEDEFSGSKPTARPVKIGRGFVHSSNYQKALMLYKKIETYDNPPFYINNIEDEEGVQKEKDAVMKENKEELLQHLLQEAKKGLNIQRYKGLGEMNPEQLWETTMNPSNRTMLQVKIEDAVETDEIFTVLMGDIVEPRREFIQNHALEVSVLDI